MRAYIRIDRNNLRNNYLKIKNKCQGKEVIAVVKGNAYGHGLKEVSKELVTFGCSSFAVASLEEAMILRKSLIFSPILLFENTSDLKTVISLKLSLSVISIKQLEDLAKTMLPIRIQLCFDLGMHRDGLLIDEAEKSLDIIKHSRLILTGIFGHHSGLDNYEKEIERFKKVKKVFGNNIFYHDASSIYLDKDNDSQGVRVGGAIYGLADDYKPILKLVAPIWCVKKVNKDEEIGYSTGNKAPGDGYIYTIPFGYADGFTRNTRIIGEIKGDKIFAVAPSMMNHTLMFSKKLYHIGDEVELINDNLNPMILSKFYKMIPYEVTTCLSPLLKRIMA